MPLLNQDRQYKVKVKFFTRWWLGFLKVTNDILLFFSLRRRKKFWGIVYDSVTKQPLDPAIVKIAYLGENYVDTCVTDLNGNYGFLAHPGKFKLLARKTNYIFPSKRVKGEHDGIYNNIYHGEFFELNDDYDVIAPNIPMDPVAYDWNQQAKLGRTRHYPYLRYLFKRIIAILFWFGYIYSMLMVISGSKYLPVIYLFLSFYFIILLLALTAPHFRLWGMVKQNVFREGRLILEITTFKFPDIVMGKAEVFPGGKFLLRTNKGDYRLVIKHELKGVVSLVGVSSIHVGLMGVVNQTIVIK